MNWTPQAIQAHAEQMAILQRRAAELKTATLLAKGRCCG